MNSSLLFFLVGQRLDNKSLCELVCTSSDILAIASAYLNDCHFHWLRVCHLFSRQITADKQTDWRFIHPLLERARTSPFKFTQEVLAHPTAFRLLLEEPDIDVGLLSQETFTHCCKEGYVDTLKMVLDYLERKNIRLYQGETIPASRVHNAMCSVVETLHVDVLEVLLSSSLNINLLMMAQASSCSIQENSLEMFQLLISNARMTPRLLSESREQVCSLGRREMVRMILAQQMIRGTILKSELILLTRTLGQTGQR